eukprot:CAMPEP_0177398710 /NCGR_PEP_ID=MMETSP0368-20130122/58061_1 /TAXON_ID=447022 ORGANISM="Scrippsiella hangoei-like, Strain SHHI-4" /NCGR_SAMPLE_ID=MMETSP0368 /ASSEMBLY_ACC=CAM_ASM_000363 /LENGTH=30 /DNA_ID= /DNA_START= /DNA_END= /DNA_ORIENTATION=
MPSESSKCRPSESRACGASNLTSKIPESSS